MAALVLRIDELVLDGFRPGDSRTIADAVQRELGRLFEAGGMPQSLTRPRNGPVHAGSLELPHDAPPDLVGARVAAAIHRALGDAAAGPRGAVPRPQMPGGGGR